MTMSKLMAAAAAVSLIAFAAPARAADDVAPILQSVLACRDIANAAERLACFDSKTGEFAAAQKRGDVVVADRRQIRESKKQLFGFSGFKLSIFGSHDDEPAPDQIEAKLKSVRQFAYGRWEFFLDNGMHWRQNDDTDVTPHAGDTVTIKSAALGSFFLRSGKGRWIRAQRVS